MNCPLLRFNNLLFCRCYRTEAPTRKTIRDFINKFQRTGNVCDEKRSGRSLTSQETVETIRQATEQSPKVSTHRLVLVGNTASQKSTVWQTLRFITEEIGLSHPGARPHPTAHLRSIFFFSPKQQSRQHRSCT